MPTPSLPFEITEKIIILTVTDLVEQERNYPTLLSSSLVNAFLLSASLVSPTWRSISQLALLRNGLVAPSAIDGFLRQLGERGMAASTRFNAELPCLASVEIVGPVYLFRAATAIRPIEHLILTNKTLVSLLGTLAAIRPPSRLTLVESVVAGSISRHLTRLEITSSSPRINLFHLVIKKPLPTGPSPLRTCRLELVDPINLVGASKRDWPPSSCFPYLTSLATNLRIISYSPSVARTFPPTLTSIEILPNPAPERYRALDPELDEEAERGDHHRGEVHDPEKFDPKQDYDVNVLRAESIVDEQGLFGSTNASHRKLESYHVNLISLGGTIGTALFVYMGAGLTSGGPANLLLAYLFWVSVIFCIAECQKCIVTFWPTDAAFARNASRYIDPAAGFAVGWNMYLNQVALVIFEVVAFGLVISYWKDAANVSVAVYMSVVLVAYAVLNLWDTRFFGNAEFGFAIGKVILILALLAMTFITMLGGNPIHDRFGFRNWKDPGAFTTPYPSHPKIIGQFEGFLFCVMNAAFTVAGPDYLSMVAGEARNPRVTMPKAFNNTIYRLVFFYIGGAIAIGVLVPFNDANLMSAQAAVLPGAARSPYVIAMQRMMIPVLPHIVNGLILTSVFSAGNAFLFCGARQLAQLSRDGHAPKWFGYRNRNGVPYWAVTASLAIGALSYCNLSASAAVVITYITNLVGAAQLVNWIVMAATYIAWDRGLKVQGLERTMPVKSRFLPYGAWYALLSGIFVLLMQGYYVFIKGAWNTPDFFFAYAMPILYAILFCGWKLIKKSKWVTPMTMDLTSFINDPEFDEMAYDDKERTGAGAVVHKVLKALF